MSENRYSVNIQFKCKRCDKKFWETYVIMDTDSIYDFEALPLHKCRDGNSGLSEVVGYDPKSKKEFL